MSATDKTRLPGYFIREMLLPMLLIGLLMLGWAAYGAHLAGHMLAGEDTTNLFRRTFEGDTRWLPQSTWIVVAVLAVILGLAALFLNAYIKGRAKQKKIDRAARYMASDKDLRGMTEKGRKKEAKAKHITGGLLPNLVKTLSGKWLRVGPEDTTTVIAGPRASKSTSLCIPLILEWDGPVVATSNKRELWKKTHKSREKGAARAWCFDPQRIVRVKPTWYWNPISYVRGDGENEMDLRAAKLASRFSFASGTGDGDSKNGGYFNLTGEGIVACLLLAAALGEKTILDVRSWITNPNDTEPLTYLRRARYTYVANTLESAQSLNGDQRQGVFGTADTMTKFLTFRSMEAWVTPGPGRTEFDPDQFVRSKDTLYSVSREGQGSMGPLITALTVAVCEAAEEYARESPGERLPVPMGLVLDEVANVCKWADLPDVYSHYGSKGIIPFAFLQSWSQGVRTWGEHGMKSLWSLSTTRIVGSGIAENGFHKSVAEMVGEYTKFSRNINHNERGISRGTSPIKDMVLNVRDIASMDRARALVFQAGAEPAIVQLVPYWDRGIKLLVDETVADDNDMDTRRTEEPPRLAHRVQPVTRIQPPDDSDEFVTARSR